MAQNLRDSFLDLERHRQLLEENIAKLRVSLRHWQAWEAEYEGLKEEILRAKSPQSREQLVGIAHEYEGDLVNRKEVDNILGPDTRDAKQVVNLLERRIDYVERNVMAVQKQVEIAERKLAAASVISTPDVRNEEGLPMTEIMEELDEEGNIISSSTSTTGSAKPQILEVLKKAGVELPAISAVPDSIRPQEEVKFALNSKPSDKSEPVSKTEASQPKKGVKFTKETKSGPEIEKTKTAKRLEDIMSIAKQSEAKHSEPPVIPTNESPEDAALRREMLQYGLSEVGAVVAELNLEEDTDEDYEDYTDNTTDDEDEYGRSTGKVVDNEMRQRMIELEDRLGVRSMQNMGKKSSDIDIVQEGVGRITINHRGDAATSNSKEIENLSSAKSDSPAYKKSVRFSEELDISPTPESAPAPTPTERRAAPVGDIRERTAPVQVTTIPGPLKIQSHFQSSRAASAKVTNDPLSASITGQTRPSLPPSLGKPLTPETFSQRLQFSTAFDNSQTVPTGPEGKTLAPQVVERDIPVNAFPGEPDDEDPQLLHQLVATEYHRMRNRMIQRQGGFLKEEETEIVPLTEEEGGPKKMSRFKAARLAKS